MKHLTLTVAAVALVGIPAMAQAGDYDKEAHMDNHNSRHTVVYEKTTHTYKTQGGVEYKADNYTPGTYKLTDGHTLQAGETSAMFVTASGSTYYAPTGEYYTTSGEKFFITDGAITGYLDKPAVEQLYANIDADRDNDGVYFERDENNVVVR